MVKIKPIIEIEEKKSLSSEYREMAYRAAVHINQIHWATTKEGWSYWNIIHCYLLDLAGGDLYSYRAGKMDKEGHAMTAATNIGSFPWDNTPQGYLCWEDVHNKLIVIAGGEI